MLEFNIGRSTVVVFQRHLVTTTRDNRCRKASITNVKSLFSSSVNINLGNDCSQQNIICLQSKNLPKMNKNIFFLLLEK